MTIEDSIHVAFRPTLNPDWMRLTWVAGWKPRLVLLKSDVKPLIFFFFFKEKGQESNNKREKERLGGKYVFRNVVVIFHLPPITLLSLLPPPPSWLLTPPPLFVYMWRKSQVPVLAGVLWLYFLYSKSREFITLTFSCTTIHCPYLLYEL